MKVIKKGRPQKGWAKEFECTGEGNKGGGCGALLLVEEEDIFISGYVGGNFRETGDPAYSFACPECNVITDIESGYYGQIPDTIKEKLRKERE